MLKVYKVYISDLSPEKTETLYNLLDRTAFMISWNPDYLQVFVEVGQTFPPTGFDEYGCAFDDVSNQIL